METSNKNKTAIFIIVIIAQLFIIIWLIYDKLDTKQETKVLITNLEYSKTEKDSLTQELEELYIEYEDLQTNNDTLNRKLQKEQEKIKEILEQLKNTKASNYYQISQMKKEITTLKSIMKTYIKQIDELNQENQQLIAENQEIKSDYNNVVSEREQLSHESDSLKGQVKLAAELQALNLSFSGLNRRGKLTSRTNKTEKFQTCFTLNKNEITSKGRKNIYIRVTDPSGKVLRNDNSGFFNYQGQSIAYSANKYINYDGTKQNVCMFYNVSQNLVNGSYTLFIFVDGKQIANHSIKMQ